MQNSVEIVHGTEGWTSHVADLCKLGHDDGHANGNIAHIPHCFFRLHIYDNSIIEILRKARKAAQQQKGKTTHLKENWLPPRI